VRISDEPEHIRGPHLGRRLGHHREEHPQVVPGGQHRVRPGPTRQELQIVSHQRLIIASNPPPRGRSRVHIQDHLDIPRPAGRNADRAIETSSRQRDKITCITCMSASFGHGAMSVRTCVAVPGEPSLLLPGPVQLSGLWVEQFAARLSN